MNINIGEIKSVILPARPLESKLKIVPWATGTDEEITAICNALDSGEITIADTGWQVGDERVVHLTPQNNSFEEQDVIMALLHEGQPKGISRVDELPIHFMTGLKEGPNVNVKMYSSASYDVPNWWGGTLARDFCNGDYKNSLPPTFVGIFKQMIVQSRYKFNDYHGGGGSFDGMKPSQDYFAIPAFYELLGESMYDSRPETDVLERWDYYQNLENIWHGNDNVPYPQRNIHWLRTTYYENGYMFCGYVYDLESRPEIYGHNWTFQTLVKNPDDNPSAFKVAPFGCF